ncbi:MAG TPA: subtype A tannase [Trebonia sp.]|nr:subtype A tannase [Trebonia sp.]
MDIERRTVLQGAAATGLLAALGLSGCTSGKSSSSVSTASTSSSGTYSLSLDDSAWHWDETNDVYYQIGNVYVSKPAAKDYENLGIYVPGAYFSAKKNSDGSYTATVNEKGTVGKFTAATAPIVIPVNTPGYASQKPPTAYSYSDASSYLKAGFVYVAPGLRGKDSTTSSHYDNAPWGVTDLKATVRYLRYNAQLIPGDQDRVVVFGMSGGGAQSAIMGTSGDSALYRPYLKSLGAALTTAGGKTISDAVAGAMCWCPITNLDYGNAAYEWNMGQFASTGTRASGTWTSAYSDDLSKAFAAYVNKLGLKDTSGKKLKLSKSSSGIYLAGSYYDYLVSVVQTSLNNFISDTTFPYTPSNAGGAPGGMGGSAPSGSKPSGGSAPSGSATAMGGSPPGGSGSSSTSTTYKTLAAYIKYLNSETTWVEYDATTKTAKVLSLAGFVKSQKTASKDVGAFDGIARGATENLVLGIGANSLHFAAVSRDLIAANQSSYARYSDWKSTYAASQYTSDFKKTDSVGRDSAYRSNIYNPMYYLSPYYAGYKSATVAPHWRIRTGIMQGDTANTTEVNLTLALQNYGIDNVDFATVWGQGHTQAERTGNATTNFITWVDETFTK